MNLPKGLKPLLDFAFANPQQQSSGSPVGQQGQIQATFLCLLVGSCWFLIVRYVQKYEFGGSFDNKTF